MTIVNLTRRLSLPGERTGDHSKVHHFPPATNCCLIADELQHHHNNLNHSVTPKTSDLGEEEEEPNYNDQFGLASAGSLHENDCTMMILSASQSQQQHFIQMSGSNNSQQNQRAIPTSDSDGSGSVTNSTTNATSTTANGSPSSGYGPESAGPHQASTIQTILNSSASSTLTSNTTNQELHDCFDSSSDRQQVQMPLKSAVKMPDGSGRTNNKKSVSSPVHNLHASPPPTGQNFSCLKPPANCLLPFCLLSLDLNLHDTKQTNALKFATKISSSLLPRNRSGRQMGQGRPPTSIGGGRLPSSTADGPQLALLNHRRQQQTFTIN